MRHKFLVLTVKKIVKIGVFTEVIVKLILGYHFLDHPVKCFRFQFRPRLYQIAWVRVDAWSRQNRLLTIKQAQCPVYFNLPSKVFVDDMQRRHMYMKCIHCCSVTTNIYRMVESNTKKSMRPIHVKKSDPIRQLDTVSW